MIILLFGAFFPSLEIRWSSKEVMGSCCSCPDKETVPDNHRNKFKVCNWCDMLWTVVLLSCRLGLWLKQNLMKIECKFLSSWNIAELQVPVATGFSCAFEKPSLTSSDGNSLDRVGFLGQFWSSGKRRSPVILIHLHFSW